MLSKICNYNSSFVLSNLAHCEGYGTKSFHLVDRDSYDFIKQLYGDDLEKDRITSTMSDNDHYSQQFVMNLEGGILNCPQPLLPNTEVKFTFERLPASYALFYKDLKDPKPTILDQNKPIDIKDCFLELEYVSSPYLRNLHAQIVERPITYYYDDTMIYMKDLSKGSQNLRVNNLCGGLTPEYIFAGLLPSTCLNPDFIKTSVRFENPDIQTACITLNGSPVQGYPITCMMAKNSMQFYSKFLDSIDKWKKSAAASTIDFMSFNNNFCLISHHFEGEQTNEGWIGFDIKFDKPTTKDYTFGES